MPIEIPMRTVQKIAAYILQKQGHMTVMKLQKLVYYAQAWSLVWDEVPLFNNRIEAWANGPVCPELYREHRGAFSVGPGDIAQTLVGLTDPEIAKDARETVEAVLGFYAGRSAHELSELTHRESPWLRARKGLAPGERGDAVITHSSMAEYYDSLTDAEIHG